MSLDILHETFQHYCLPQGEKKINLCDRKILYYLIGYKELEIKNRRKMKTQSPVPCANIPDTVFWMKKQEMPKKSQKKANAKFPISSDF